MLVDFETAILNRLTEKGIPNVQGWSGKPDELFIKPKTFPAARYVFEGLDFISIGAFSYTTVIKCSIILFFHTFKDKGQGAYPLIETILNALSGFYADGFYLEPKKIELLFHESIDFAYQIQFEAVGKYVVEDEPESLTTKITTYESQELSTEVSV